MPRNPKVNGRYKSHKRCVSPNYMEYTASGDYIITCPSRNVASLPLGATFYYLELSPVFSSSSKALLL